MVKHVYAMKTSSTTQRRTPKRYECRVLVCFQALRPESLTLETQPDIWGGIRAYWVTGLLGTDLVRWTHDVHRVFANLPATISSQALDAPLVDPQAMVGFIKKYGSFRGDTKRNEFQDYFERSIRLVDVLTQVDELAEADASFGLAKERAEIFAKADSQSLL